MAHSKESLLEYQVAIRKESSLVSYTGSSNIPHGSESTSMPTERTPYFILGTMDDIQLYNAVGIVALVLLDDHNMRNRISGFNTLFALFNRNTLTSETVRSSFSAYGYNIYPERVNCVSDLYSRIKFQDWRVEAAFGNLFFGNSERHSHSLVKEVIALYDEAATKLSLAWNRSLEFNFKYIIALCGAVYLLMFKSPLQKNYNFWIQKIWTEMSKAVGLTSSQYCPDEKLLPPYESCKAIHAAFSACFEARKIMFQNILEKVNEPSCWGAVCLVLSKFAEFTELEHICVICKYLLPLPGLRNRIIDSELELLMDAFECFHSSEANVTVIPYLKIFLKDDIAKKFSASNFPNLSWLAYATGASENHLLWTYADFIFKESGIFDMELIDRELIDRMPKGKNQNCTQDNSSHYERSPIKEISSFFATAKILLYSYVK